MSSPGERSSEDEATQALGEIGSEESVKRFDLVFVSGPRAERRIALDADGPSTLWIGQGPACDVKIADPTVSRRHAALSLLRSGLRVRDLGSTNGTFVNDVRVFDAFLRGGETLRFGETTLRVEAGDERRAQLSEQTRFGRVIGSSPAMRRLYPLFTRLSQSTLSMVIEGETGTGKEQLARALHEQGPRSEGPFVVFDCTAVAPSLIESELFGHERGSFTGSVGTRKGVFERAHGGTLLIDEIGDLPLDLQPKLLRVLEQAELTRVGGNEAIQVDVRVIAATRRNLDLEVQKGRFRDDLFHRLVVARVELPPLRERKGDVRLLALEFCRQLGALSLPDELLAQWADDAWPGNVRELKNAVARRIALGDLEDLAVAERDTLQPPGLPALARRDDPFARVLAEELPLAEARARVVEEFEARYVEHVLDLHAGNVTRAAATAGVGRRHMQRMKLKLRGE